jgi:8-oxo-dGTP pyrophosphatase MutT (NUDIX family)
MIRRKDTFGYIDFIRGKYSPYNIEQIKLCVDQMSSLEKEKILNEPFDKLWKELWNNENQYRSEEFSSSKKFDLIRNGIMLSSGERVNLHRIIGMSETTFTEPEWEFPKGRRNFQEKDLDCALREFEEETGISKNNFLIIDNLLPFEEMYIGSNYKCYKHKYFLAFMNKSEELLQNFQKTEVSKLDWKNIEQCLESIRPYNLEKKQLILNINKVLQEYRIYS